MENYFYDFLNQISEEFTRTLRELENAIYNSPRSMLTHSRTFIETLLEKVMIHENMENEPYLTIIERIQDLDESGLLTDEVKNSLHEVRKLGNKAAHDTRQFRFSESLTAWEHIYIIVKWFVEVYGSHDIEVPEYVDPVMRRDHSYDLEEMNFRFQKIEELLKQAVQNEQPKQVSVDSHNLNAKSTNDADSETGGPVEKQEVSLSETMDKAPGLIPIRTISYGNDGVEVPYFLRDTFLLPQRFENSERFLVRLGGVEEARIMSELPERLDGFHNRIVRYNETHSEVFFSELKNFINEEIRRRKLMQNRPGELFLFYKSEEIVVTEELGKIEINKENFTGMPGLIDQLNEDGIKFVRDLPKELVILGKYKGVGTSRVESFFNQLKEKQVSKIEELV
ncbi:DUF4145 domain-containing protein [Allobacillus sp. GCM10007491]|uniref:DUF4145 domain-containing protein n=1 Tax=Allobacillus saliphilus TaxID=2912308 RepID=A0A941CSX4_9BACI|nr:MULTISPECIES: DUF4145 domain-containing protein [Allobacillus]MBR7553114.1 DUF4145 domain-containing protein [Allobacillus saliphilus]